MKVTNATVVIDRGGSANGRLATTKRKVGKTVMYVTERVGQGGNTQRLTHHPVFVDDSGVEHISLDKRTFVPLVGIKILRRETKIFGRNYRASKS
jgi:hypothetical protein